MSMLMQSLIDPLKSVVENVKVNAKLNRPPFLKSVAENANVKVVFVRPRNASVISLKFTRKLKKEKRTKKTIVFNVFRIWSKHITITLIDVRLYSAILRSLEQTHCARMWFYMSD